MSDDKDATELEWVLARALAQFSKTGPDVKDMVDSVKRTLHAAGYQITKAEDEYLIWSNEHTAWWRPNSRGYCRDVRKAGVYSKETAVGISFSGRDGWGGPCETPDEIAVPISCIPKAFLPSPPVQEEAP